MCKTLINIGDEKSFKANVHWVEKCNEVRYLRDLLQTNMLIFNWKNTGEPKISDFCNQMLEDFRAKVTF
jgi:hypothetical protein